MPRKKPDPPNMDPKTPIKNAMDKIAADFGENLKAEIKEKFEAGPTPANSAGKDVAREHLVRFTFNVLEDEGDRTYRLPALPGPEQNSIGHLADVFFASGYFGHLTPAQIAVHIIAGRSLGLDDAQSVFDLDIQPGPTIAYRKKQTYQETADAIEDRRATL